MYKFADKTIEDYKQEMMKIYQNNGTIPVVKEEPVKTVQPESIQSQPTENNQDNYSNFKAEVYVADQAYPLPGAKVKLTRNGELVAFLKTESNGQTKVVPIKSPPKENSLEPYSAIKSIDYNADVYAEGFVTKKNLLVSAVGDTLAILQINVNPVSERVI